MNMLFAGILVSALMTIPLFAAENAQSVYELERSGTMDPARFQLRGDTPDQKYNYKVGQEIRFHLRFDCGQKGHLKGWQFLVKRFGEDGVKDERKIPVENGKTVIYKTKGAAPGFVIVKAIVLDETGKPVMVPNGKRKRILTYTGGIGVELEKLKAAPLPEDFDAYWNQVVKTVYASKTNGKLTPVPSKNPNEKLFIFQVSCGKSMESVGYISMPAKPGKYPLSIHFHGYGPVVSVPKTTSNGKEISVSVSRFGLIPGQASEYYRKEARKFDRYGFKNNGSRETSFFKGMLVRDLTALKFLKSLPEWDHQNLMVEGGSMGGLQVFWMAGLDKDVTDANISYPWCCDLQAPNLKRAVSFFAPEFTPELRYFDAVNFAHRIPKTCKVYIATGIGDECCPISGVFRAYVSIPGPKTIKLIQGPTHAICHHNPQFYRFSGNPVPAE